MKRKRAAGANSGRAEHRAARASSGRAKHRAARASSGRAEHRLSLCPQVLAGRLHHDVAPWKLTATTSLSYANQQSKSIKKKRKRAGRGGLGWDGRGGGGGLGDHQTCTTQICQFYLTRLCPVQKHQSLCPQNQRSPPVLLWLPRQRQWSEYRVSELN